MWSIYMMEYYSALKRKELLLIHAVTWISVEDITLSEIIPSQKGNTMTPLIWGT